jgi:quinol monooxygenase YgiN
MALGLYFTPSAFTKDKYDEALRRLEEAGAGAPGGRFYHVALETNGQIQVLDIWESQEAFEAFGQTLVPILSELGVDPGEPMASPVHNVIEG